MVAARFLPRFAKRLRETVKRAGAAELEARPWDEDGAAGVGLYSPVA